MNRAKFCVQAMTIKKAFKEEGIYKTFEKVANLGYSCIELSQVPMDEESIQIMGKAAREFKIEIPAISANLESVNDSEQESLMKNFNELLLKCKKLNAAYIRMGVMPYPYLASEKRLLEFCKKCEEMAQRLKEHDIDLYYHNHHVEFQKLNGQYVLDILKSNTPHMGFELDVHWIQRGGENPVEMIKKYNGRVDLLHLKDYRIKNIPNDICKQSDFGSYMDYFNSCIEFAEVGSGNLDMNTIIDTGLSAGSKYFIIEQDETYDKDPFESLNISAVNLRKMGYEELF